MFCTKCGAKLCDDAKFCQICGEKVNNDNKNSEFDYKADKVAEKVKEEAGNLYREGKNLIDNVDKSFDNFVDNSKNYFSQVGQSKYYKGVLAVAIIASIWFLVKFFGFLINIKNSFYYVKIFAIGTWTGLLLQFGYMISMGVIAFISIMYLVKIKKNLEKENTCFVFVPVVIGAILRFLLLIVIIIETLYFAIIYSYFGTYTISAIIGNIYKAFFPIALPFGFIIILVKSGNIKIDKSFISGMEDVKNSIKLIIQSWKIKNI